MAVMVQVSRLRHAEVAVVAPGRDPVPDPEPFTGVGDDRVGVVDVPGGDEPVADRAVQRGCLLAGVGHHQHAAVPEPLSPVWMASAASWASAWVRSASLA